MNDAYTAGLSDLREVHQRHIAFLREQLLLVSAERTTLRDELFSMRMAESQRSMDEKLRRHLHWMIAVWALTVMSTIGLNFKH